MAIITQYRNHNFGFQSPEHDKLTWLGLEFLADWVFVQKLSTYWQVDRQTTMCTVILMHNANAVYLDITHNKIGATLVCGSARQPSPPKLLRMICKKLPFNFVIGASFQITH